MSISNLNSNFEQAWSLKNSKFVFCIMATVPKTKKDILKKLATYLRCEKNDVAIPSVDELDGKNIFAKK